MCNIRALVALFHLFGVFHPLFPLLVDAINFVKAGFAKRARVFAFRPFLDATKAEPVVAAVELSKVIRFYIVHANTAVLGNSCGFLIRSIIIPV